MVVWLYFPKNHVTVPDHGFILANIIMLDVHSLLKVGVWCGGGGGGGWQW